MGRSFWPVLFYSITISLKLVSADFGFTNPSFEYVQLSSPVNLAWNGQSGQVSLRLMVYPGDSVQSYIPIAANLTTSAYTWIPDSLTTGSKWSLEGIDEDGNIASLVNPFAVQGSSAASPITATQTLLQQNPTSSPSTLATSTSTSTSKSTSAPASSSTSTNSPEDDNDDEHSMPTGVLVGIFVGAILGAAIIVALLTYIFLQKRRSKQNTLRRDSVVELEKASGKMFELEGNESVLTLPRPVLELKGSALPGSVPTSMGERVELG